MPCPVFRAGDTTVDVFSTPETGSVADAAGAGESDPPVFLV